MHFWECDLALKYLQKKTSEFQVEYKLQRTDEIVRRTMCAIHGTEIIDQRYTAFEEEQPHMTRKEGEGLTPPLACKDAFHLVRVRIRAPDPKWFSCSPRCSKLLVATEHGVYLERL